MRIYYKYWFFVSAPIVIVLWLGVLGRDFVTLAISHNPTLNYAILGVMAGAVMLSLATHLRFWNEALAIERFAAAMAQAPQEPATTSVTRGKSGVSALLAAIERGLRQPGGIADKGALIGELDTVRSSYAARFSLPHFLAGFMVALGLFGTFIGLLETLNATSALLGRFSIGGSPNGAGDAVGQAVGRLVVGMTGPLGGMGTAFSASLFGLLGSLLLGAISSASEGMSGRIIERLRGLIDGLVAGGAAGYQSSSARHPSDQNPVLSPEFLSSFLNDIIAQQKNLADLTAQGLRADLEARQFLADLAEQFAAGSLHVARVAELLRNVQQNADEQSRRIDALTDLQLQNGHLINASHKVMQEVSAVLQSVEQGAREAVTSAASVAHSQDTISDTLDRLPQLLLEGSRTSAKMQAAQADHLEKVEREHVHTLRQLIMELGDRHQEATYLFVEQGQRLERTNGMIERLLDAVTLARSEPHGWVPAIELLLGRLEISRAELHRDVTAQLRDISRQLAQQQRASTQ